MKVYDIVKSQRDEKETFMKKLLTLICSAGLLFSMAACSGSKVQDKALDALETSLNKIVEMKTATYSMGMDAKSGDETATLKISGGYC